jgi:hypothetical protein
MRMASRGEIEFRRFQLTIGPSTLTDLGYAGRNPGSSIELDRAGCERFLGRSRPPVRAADRLGGSARLSDDVARCRPFADRQLWRSPEAPPHPTERKPSARMT